MRARRLPWADLPRRVFAEDVLTCPSGGHRSVTAFVTDQRVASSLSGGFSVQGWLVYPRDFDPARRYPMIVSPHGGRPRGA
jgi:dipeptidyl aminopeptidase/acylaminoacyl peptidase